MKKPLFVLTTLLALKALFLLWLIVSGIIGLGPDEAQYWTWSEALDIGYYSKPPGIAWQIFSGTALFGDTELGVRFVAVIIGFLIPLAVFYLAKVCHLKDDGAFFAALAVAFSPYGLAYSFLATTDPALLLFWVLSLVFILKGNYRRAGITIALGALFKWPIYLLWLFALKRNKKLLAGVGISLLGLLPMFFWNLEHNFVTFRHVFRAVFVADGKMGGDISGGNFFSFLGAQAAIVSPILFILMIFAFWRVIRGKSGGRIYFVARSVLAIFFAAAILSLFRKVQGNWIAFIYPQAALLIADLPAFRRWLKIGVAFALFLCSLILTVPVLQNAGFAVPYRLNVFRHNVGWRQMEKELVGCGYDPERHFLFSDKYQMASLLSFYSPGQKRAYFFNLQGSRRNQFAFWPSMGVSEKGGSGFFVLADNTPYLEKHLVDWRQKYSNLLRPYFKEVVFLGIKPLFKIDGRMVKGAIFFRCDDYNGKMPPETDKY